MPWLQISLNAGELNPEDVSDCFTELGAISVTLLDAEDEPLLEPPPGATPLWSHTRVVGLFEDGTDPAHLKQQITDVLGAAVSNRLGIETLDDRDWERAWMDDFHPMCFGERLWICPSNAEPPDPNAINLMLDPGLAFGTGTHPTTALCLEWLDAHPPTGMIVVDYGCGSGILAIAALKLGASEVWAVDNDPQALVATWDNASRNAVLENLHVISPDELPDIKADVVLANILVGPLIKLAPRFGSLVRPGGQVVLSGILADQAKGITEAYQSGFDLEPTARRDEWVRIVGVRREESRV